VLLVFVAFVWISVASALVGVDDENGLRLIEFNETHRAWMTPSEVELLAGECGAHEEGKGFMDVTGHQKLSAKDLKVTISDLPDHPSHQPLVNQLNKLISTQQITDFNSALTSFHTRYYNSATGKEAAGYIYDQFKTLGKQNSKVEVEFFDHSWLQPSVIARIPGVGVYADEVVIISAHEDSIVFDGATARSPGSDDDGSGTSCVLEAFRVLVQGGYIPSRTIEFHTYAAEEVGLKGSQDIAASYQKAQKKVYAQMQMDMTMYPGTPGTIAVITDYTDKSLTNFVTQLIQTYTSLQWGGSNCGYACSDHASWTKAGYRSSFPFEAAFEKDNPNIHTKNDVWDILNVDQGAEFVRIAVGFAVELASSN